MDGLKKKILDYNLFINVKNGIFKIYGEFYQLQGDISTLNFHNLVNGNLFWIRL